MSKVSIPVEVRPIKNRSNRITGYHAWIADGYGGEALSVRVIDKESAVPYLGACLSRLLDAEMPAAVWASDGRTVFLVRSVGGGQTFGYEIVHAGKSSGCLVSGFATKDEARKAAEKHASDYAEVSTKHELAAAPVDLNENPPTDWEECGGCGCYHPPDFAGDCRDDTNRWPFSSEPYMNAHPLSTKG